MNINQENAMFEMILERNNIIINLHQQIDFQKKRGDDLEKKVADLEAKLSEKEVRDVL